jgi:7-keto-8-aminopelargonate synthetase-like enzyme
MTDKLTFITEDVANLKEQGLFINIRTMDSPVDAWMTVDGKRVLNFCTNNYLGLANHPRIKAAAKRAIDGWGVGPGAVRTIAGTQKLHLELERRVAQFKGVEASMYVQGGLVANQIAIPALVGREDVVFSDRLNHASIIDGCRLSRAKIVVYEHCDPEGAERVIGENIGQYRRGLLVTDGVFSMDGDVAPLDKLYEVAERYGVMTMVDDAHGEGVLGRGAVDLLEESTELVDKLWENTRTFKAEMQNLGFDTGQTETPIVPVMLGEAPLAKRFSARLFEEGVFAMALGFPTVPRGQARIRVMNTAAHSQDDLDKGLEAFEKVGKELGVIP